ncbi:MAG: nucleotidyltransferase domain-containing protein [Myxococcota bacterium]
MSTDFAIPDLDRARRFVATYAPPGEALLVAVTGAHLYGFPSPDSDVDLKGVHQAETASLLGLEIPDETHDVLRDFEGIEHDLTTHELRKAFTLLLGGNGNLLEQVFSPIQLFEGETLEALRELARGAISRRHARHYRGFFGGCQREHAREPRVKSMLYAYRVALTGVHLLRTGECIADVRELGPRYGFEDVLELVALKGSGQEKGPLPPELDRVHRARWPKLEAALDDALETSPLPEEPRGRDAIDAWLVARRQG